MDISPVTTSHAPSNNAWAISADWVESVTVDGAVGFDPATHFPAGILPSGTALAKVTASAKYALYDQDAVDGRTVFVGFTHGDITISATKSVGAAMLTHGQVREAQLPFAVAGTAWADNPLIRRI
jgi:hypothetical protein